ncbi:DEAD/DEAH box helicase [Heyndrickxia coagulans]|uniref:DEAD/DEAH box helicase n=1 Tax=Heyndrickxia coagulans TaxID=1398 RepID=UPI0023E47854|nr:DEAD/DEAH box helicase [Heyndrickxia coagulans]
MPSVFSEQLQRHLAGRILFEPEIPFSPELLDQHFKQGWIRAEPAIQGEFPHCVCLRCGNRAPHLFAEFPCAHCGKTSIYCRNCLMMGRVTACKPLITWAGPAPAFHSPRHPLHWDGTLSEGQQAASEAVKAAILQKNELLIWAVCGSGKTEIVFKGIEAALANGERVCIATPRTDVVLELAPRFRRVFPDIPIAALYGGSPDRHKWAQLVISTTHQLYRFASAFDVVIVDEVDAFPYTFDETLQCAVQKAAKDRCARIYLTATPSETWQLECKTGKRPFVTIPARYHRKPLPVPVFKWAGNWRKKFEKGKLPVPVEAWVKKRLESGKQALLFLPNIRLMKKAEPVFKQLHPAIESVHAEDPDRKEKVERMRAGKTPLLLTTTILERGVTFPDIDVCVVGAEDAIFTEAALVQIAGRAGRSADFPNGDVTFFHYGKSNAMVKAQRHILSMNEEAGKRGLLDA